MGIYLNPDNTAFREALNSQIYVDKTGLIAHTNRILNTENRFLLITRPRRFGKSMTANMLTAYYSRGCNSAEMFAQSTPQKSCCQLYFPAILKLSIR